MLKPRADLVMGITYATEAWRYSVFGGRLGIRRSVRCFQIGSETRRKERCERAVHRAMWHISTGSAPRALRLPSCGKSGPHGHLRRQVGIAQGLPTLGVLVPSFAKGGTRVSKLRHVIMFHQFPSPSKIDEMCTILDTVAAKWATTHVSSNGSIKCFIACFIKPMSHLRRPNPSAEISTIPRKCPPGRLRSG